MGVSSLRLRRREKWWRRVEEEGRQDTGRVQGKGRARHRFYGVDETEKKFENNMSTDHGTLDRDLFKEKRQF